MAHPYAGKAMTSRDRAKEISKGYKLGGAVGKSATANVKKYAGGGEVKAEDEWDKDWYTKDGKKQYVKGGGKIEGKASGGRLDKFARGGRTKHKGGHHTKININIAPKGLNPPDGAASPGLGGPPPMAGGPPPPGLGGPPPGGPPLGLGGAPPGAPPGLPPGIGGPKPPGMMKRGGVVKKAEGGPVGQEQQDASQENAGKRSAPYNEPIKKARGGGIPMKGGAETGQGRLDKAKAYKARG